MANIFGVNVETPQEQQERLLKRIQAGQKNLTNVNQQFGYNLAIALSQSFGGMKKQRVAAEDRAEAISEGRREGDLDFVGENERLQKDFQDITSKNAQLVAEGVLASGGTMEQAQAAAKKYAITNAGTMNQARVSASANAVREEKDKRVKAGADPIDAEVAAMGHAAAKLRELGGPENTMLANQISSNMSQLHQQQEERRLKMDNLKADTAKKRADAGDSADIDGLSDVDKLRFRGEKLRGRLQQLDSSSKEYATISQMIVDNDAALAEETGASPTAGIITKFGETRTAVESVKHTADVFDSVFTDALTKEPGAANLALNTGTAFATFSDGLMKLQLGAELFNFDSLSKGIADLRGSFVKNLTASGIDEADAIRVYQEVRGAVIAQARSFGGPITESDLEQAMAASGVSSGRLDIFLEKQISNAELVLDNLVAEADLQGSLVPGSTLAKRIDKQRANIASSKKVLKRLLDSQMFKSPKEEEEKTELKQATITYHD